MTTKIETYNVTNSKFPYSVLFHKVDFYEDDVNLIDMYAWCEETFGNSAIVGQTATNESWIRQFNGMRFRDESARNWFLMRWG